MLLRACSFATPTSVAGHAVQSVALLAGAAQSLPGQVAALVGGGSSLVDVALDQRVDEGQVGEDEGHEGLSYRPKS